MHYFSSTSHHMKHCEMTVDDIRQFAGVVMRTGSELIDWLNAVA
jgi:hypothetical protein